MPHYWSWSDDRGAAGAFAGAAARAVAAAWTPSDQAAADLRALLSRTLLVVAGLGRTVEFQDGAAYCTIDGQAFAFPSADHEQAARILLATPLALAPDGAIPKNPALITAGGQDAGAFGWPAAAAVIAICVAVSGLAAAWCSENAAQVIDRHLARSAAAQQLAATQARAVDLANAHLTAESKAGQPLPWSDGEKRLLGELLAAQERFVGRSVNEPPLPTNTGGGFFAGLGTGGALLAIGALWLLLKESRAG